MSMKAGNLLWARKRFNIQPAAEPPDPSNDIDTGIFQTERSLGANSVGEPQMPEPTGSGPSRLMVIPLAGSGIDPDGSGVAASWANWVGMTHGEPFAFLNVSGPNAGKVTMHVVFATSSQTPVGVNCLFWDPHTAVGPGLADFYNPIG